MTQKQDSSEHPKPTPPENQDLHQSWYQEEAPHRSRRKFWIFQLCLFLTALSIGVYPYLKKQFPVLEKLLQPATYYQRLGHESFQQNYYQQAIDHYHKALQVGGFLGALKKTERAIAYYQIARGHAYLRQYDRAIRYASQAQLQHPDWLPAYALVLELYTQLQQHDRFEQLTKTLARQFPQNWQAWLLQGNGHLHFQQEKQATAAYQQAIRILREATQHLTPEDPTYTRLTTKQKQLEAQLQRLQQEQAQRTQQTALLSPPQRVSSAVAASSGSDQTSRDVPPSSAQPSGIVWPTTTASAAQTGPPAAATTMPAPSGFSDPELGPASTSLPLPRHRTHQRSQQLLLPVFDSPTTKKSP